MYLLVLKWVKSERHHLQKAVRDRKAPRMMKMAKPMKWAMMTMCNIG